MQPKISLEQWRALMAVVDAGGYAQAAEALHKSQSAITYAVQKLESVLAVKAFEMQGRKAVLTPTGQLLYRRAKALLDEASGLEQAASALAAGWEAEIRLAVEVVFPTWLLLQVLDRFGQDSPHTRIELTESVMGGTAEALLQGKADLAVGPSVPPGFFGEVLKPFRAVPVAHPDHPLHQLGRPLKLEDLRQHRHIVVRDTSSKRSAATLSIEAKQRWTVSNMATSIHALCQGYGFSWMVEDKIRHELQSGLLKPLPLEGQERHGTLYLIFADPDYAGRGTQLLAKLLREATASACAAAAAAPPE